MSYRAWTYIWLVLIAATGLTVVSTVGPPYTIVPITSFGWMTFGTLVLLATVAQLFEATHGKQSYYPHIVFFFAAVLLLPPALFILVVLIPHIVEWGKERLVKGPHLRNWYIQPFNISSHVIAGLIAYWTYNLVTSNTQPLVALSPVVSVIAAALIYIAVNHILVGQALVLARNISWKESGVLAVPSLLPDVIMAFLGYVVSVLWKINPWLLLPALSPLVLMYQALMIPQLKQEAQTDSKTGLWNARHFASLFAVEMERAKRFNRPMSIIMADLDLLRNINNTYGHMAGDAVLTGVGRIIRETIREYDIAGRFGGEEFAIALPETDADEALIIAERLRLAVEEDSFLVTTSPTPIEVTMSIGVASFPGDAQTLAELVHEADVAVYQAKLNGRNCVVCTSEVPHFVKLGIASTITDRLSVSSIPGFIPRPDEVLMTSSQSSVVEGRDYDPLHSSANGANAAPDMDTNLQEEVAALTSESSHSAQQVELGFAQAAQPPEQAAHIRIDQGPGTSVPKGNPDQSSLIAHSPSLKRALTTDTSPALSSSKMFKWYVSTVISAGTLLALVGGWVSPMPDLATLALLVVLAAVVELLQINVYGESTVSVSVAVAFATALIAGIPGVAAVSAAIALAHYYQMHPAPYKTAFNWATHVLAGGAPALMIGVLSVDIMTVKLQLAHLIILGFPTIAAALLYYGIETGLVAGAISLSKGASFVITWKGQFQWLLSHYLVLCAMGLFLGIAYTALGSVGVVVFALPVFMMRYAQKQYVESTRDSTRALKRMNEQLTLANREVTGANMAMHNLNDELFRTLATIIDARDPYVSNHAAKVAEYAVAIATELGVSQERMEPLRQAGFLHDIGKIGISEEVLHKPGKLTVSEYEYVKTHAALGGEFLEMCQALRHLAPFVRHHHERWDGMGYPDGLKGEEIPLEARILGVCDAAEAMASDRPYRKGAQLHELVAEVARCAGTQFDPAVSAAFVRVVEREKEGLVTNSAIDLRQQSQRETLTTRHLTGALLTGSLNGHLADSITGNLTNPLTGPMVTGNLGGPQQHNTGPFKKKSGLAASSGL